MRLTLVARVSDGLPLAASMEDEKEHRQMDDYKTQAKKIVKRLNSTSPPRISIESGGSFFHYIHHDGVCFLCLAEKGYPKRLAFNYLEELQTEFMGKYREGIETASRPYAFIKFDTFIQKTKKMYADTRTQRNLSKMNEDLADVQKIMTQNIHDVLGRAVMNKSTHLRDASGKYAKSARQLNLHALLRKYGPGVIVVLFVAGGLWWRFFR